MGVRSMWLFASLTAVPFYEADGWRFVEESNRGTMACVKMEKGLFKDAEKEFV